LVDAASLLAQFHSFFRFPTCAIIEAYPSGWGLPTGDTTRLLRKVSAGDTNAEGELIEHVYQDLRRLAGAYMRRERSGHTLQPTELVGKAFLRLCRESEIEFQDRAHFFRVAAVVMRRILVDHARARKAGKRGGGVRIPLDDIFPGPAAQIDLILDVDRALAKLESLDNRLAQIVVMRFFGGLSEEEIGTTLGIHVRTIRREWKTAKTWLRGELASNAGGSSIQNL
jgi:RNA polymerase sigma-70 factor (ECF subfamily)